MTDRQTDGRTLGDSKDRAYAQSRAVKTRVMLIPDGGKSLTISAFV